MTGGPWRAPWLGAVAMLCACDVPAASNPQYGAACEHTRYLGFCIDAPAADAATDAGRDSPDAGGPPMGAGAGAGCREGELAWCYPGEPEEAERGLCRAGLRTCRAGQWSACEGHRTPAAGELCNGADDDCDGAIDEAISETCYEGTSGCTWSDGALVCVGVCSGGTRSCTRGVMGPCEGAVMPADTDGCEAGTGFDEDCDGLVDEDCLCLPGTTRECFGGPSTALLDGPCRSGIATCQATGRFGACEGDVLPTPETCDDEGSDDDCNGRVDDVFGRGLGCVEDSQHGLCRNGTLECVDGALACATPQPASGERCDGLDDDCDGSVDEAFALFSDPEHCGACGNACADGGVCCGGACESASSSACVACDEDCAELGESCCGGQCTDLDTSEASCGACGDACASGEYCCGGSCAPSSAERCGGSCESCGGDALCCDGACVSAGGSNCGACGVSCGESETCCGLDGCRDLDADAHHCGACGTRCRGNEECADGTCRRTNRGDQGDETG